jgi:hypothetical protein
MFIYNTMFLLDTCIWIEEYFNYDSNNILGKVILFTTNFQQLFESGTRKNTGHFRWNFIIILIYFDDTEEHMLLSVLFFHYYFLFYFKLTDFLLSIYVCHSHLSQSGSHFASVIVWLFCWTQLLNIASVLSTSIRVSPDGSISLLFSVHGDPSLVCK